MKYFKTTLLLLIFINMINLFSCTPASLTEEDENQKEQFNNHIQTTDDGDKEIDKSGKED